jgi:hypothetical protein
VADTEARASFTTELKTEGTAGVKEQVSALEKLEDSSKSLNAVLGKMQLNYRNLKTGGHVNSLAAQELKKRIAEQKKAIGENALAINKMKGAFDVNTKSQKGSAKATKESTSALARLAAGARLGGGPIATLADRSGSLAGSLGKAGLVGAAVAAGVALVALDYAAIKSAVSIATAAVTSANAYRTENLELQGLTKTWSNFWGITQVAPGNADKMQSAINRVTSEVTLQRDKVIGLNSELYSMRLRGNNLALALKAVALAESGAGDKGKQWAMGQIYMNAMLGRSMQNVSNIAEKRFGKIVSAKMLDLNVQTAKAKENFSALFRGIKIEPLLKGVDKVLGFFKQGTVQAEAWSGIFESLFNPLFRDATKGGDVIKTFMNKVTILALNASIAWEDMGASFSLQKFGIKDTSDLLVKVTTVAGGFAVMMLRAADATLYIAQGIARIGTGLSGIYQMVKAAAGTGSLGELLFSSKGAAARKGVGAGWETFKSAFGDQGKTAEVGHSMIDGLIKGIQDAQPYLNKAAADSMKEAEQAAKDAAKVKSPSRAWRVNIGQMLPKGGALGIRDAAPRMRREAATALSSIGPTSRDGSSFGGGGASARSAFGGGGPTQISVGNVTFQQAATNAPGTVTIPEAQFTSWFASKLEGLAHQRGANI